MRSSLALILAAVAGSIAFSAQTAPLKLVSSARPPFSNPTGGPRFALDLVEAALGRIGIRSTTTIVSPADYTASLLTGPFDGSATAWKDADRERALLFSQPFLENRMVLVARRGADVSAKTLADLTGKRVALVAGFSYGDRVEDTGPLFLRSTSDENSLTRLLKGDVEYTLMDELVVDYITKSYPKEVQSKLALGTTPILVREMHLAVRRSRPDAETIITGFNSQIRAMIADRTYHRLLHLDWIRADMNGDGVPEYIPLSDQAGPNEPKNVYNLFTTDVMAAKDEPEPGFYLGGNLYANWLSVPDTYKLVHSDRENPSRSTASLFHFKW
jgi:ABC-type amino acid transport substrate-binding protein